MSEDYYRNIKSFRVVMSRDAGQVRVKLVEFLNVYNQVEIAHTLDSIINEWLEQKQKGSQ